MAMFLSSILSDLTTRSISFLIDKRLRSTSPPPVEEMLNNLQRLLLRVHVIVEEADERHISNQAMLRQLSQLREDMYRGYHTLDTFRCRVSPSLTTSTSIFSPAKRIRFSSDGSSSEQEQLSQVLGCLEAAIRDTSELVVFLSGCPRRCRQPYSMYLILDKCMFGRQMEMEIIMEFLLQDEVPIDGNPGVLPIVGPKRVGKSTLIEHACNNERVRNHFSQIMCFKRCGTKDERTVASLSDCDVIKHRSLATGEDGRVLVIIEVVGDMEEDVWRKLYSDCKHRVAGGSKIIVASRSDKIARFGTTQALKVRLLTPEEYWYFFKVRTFGSMDTQDHPKLASIAMDLAHEMPLWSFFTASGFSALLKANFDAHFWSMALASVKRCKRINLTPEEYWYFFKVRTFGSMDTQDHPKLASIAMDLAHEMPLWSFFTASGFSALLKANFDAHFWSMALASVKRCKRINPLIHGEQRDDFWHGIKPINIQRVNKTSSEYLVILQDYETGFVQDMAQSEGPKMSILDFLFGSNSDRPRGRFEVVAWRSHIPPHYSYMWE